jgi:Tfp pilus assembly protein PilX
MKATEPEDLALIEKTLLGALPGYEIEVTIDHPKRAEDLFYIEANGFADNRLTDIMAAVLTRFKSGATPTLQ